MIQRIAFFEDDGWRRLMPLCLLRPVFELCCGHGSVRERLRRRFASADCGALVREALAEAYQEEHPELAVNKLGWLREAPTRLVNGRWLGPLSALASLADQAVGVVDDFPVSLTLHPSEVDLVAAEGVSAAVEMLAAVRRPQPLPGTLLTYPWHVINHNRDWLVTDFRQRVSQPTKAAPVPHVAILGSDADVFIHPSAEVDPFVAIDAREGPVWVDEQVRLQAFTRLEGPCFIGRGSQLFRANVKAGTTIGPVCRVGGEIEECIFHGFANKYHDGFLGHAYVCPWVNLGALTTNSDLKNDYSSVKVVVSGEAVDSGSRKVGCFIGDHTKTAIGSFFNTGTSVGAMSLILPAGELLPKHIPPFSRIWHGELEALDEAGLDAAIQTARIAMTRRGVDLTPAAERLLRNAYQETHSLRHDALSRTTGRRAAGVPR
jgi:UDP-N-acetylglucosamine diphosphorylase/glucosamine-1-phosphate N-acetyltransferase